MAKTKPSKDKQQPIKQPISFWERKYFFEIIILSFTCFLFTNSITNGYNLDDELVTINHRLTSQGVSAIPDIFTSPYYQDASGYSYEYRPTVLASFAIEHQFFGDNPHVSHFFNVLLYALACLLLYRVLLLLFTGFSIIIPLGITLIFAAHPSHTEVVCSIKNRDEILGLLFSLAAFYYILKGVASSRQWFFLFAFLLFLLALMSKVTVISFVAIIPLALIFFTHARFRNILLATLILLVPTYFLINIGSGQQRILIIVGLFLCVIFFYCVVHAREIFNMVAGWIHQLSGRIFKQRARQNSAVIETSDYTLQGMFKGILPERGIVLSPLPASIACGLAVLYLFWLGSSHSLLAFIPVIILLVLAWAGGRRFSWWAQAMILIILSYNLNLSQYHQMAGTLIIYIKLVAVFLGFQLYYGRRDLFIPAVIGFAIFNYTNYAVFDNPDAIISMFFIVLVFRYVRYAIVAIMAIRILNLLTLNIHPNADDFSIYQISDMVFSLAVILIIEFRKGGKIFFFAAAVLCFILFHIQTAPKDQPLHVRSDIQNAYMATDKINPQIVSTPQNRPLEYVEECVSLNSPLSVRMGTSLEITLHYLQKVAVPYPLSFYYGYKFIYPQKVTDTIPIISLIVHLLLLLLAFIFIKIDRRISFGLFIYLLSIAVFSNYFQLAPGMIADRFLLIPSLGWAIVLTVGLVRIFRINDRSLNYGAIFEIPAFAKYAFAAIIIFYGATTIARNMDWKDYLTLFRHDIKYVDNSSQAHNLLAIRLMKTSYEISDPVEQSALRHEAIGHFEKAIHIYPDFFNVAYDMGRTYSVLNMPDSAIVAYKHSIALNHDFSDSYMAVGELLAQQNKIPEAIPYFQFLIDKFPDQYIGYDKTSLMYFIMKKYNVAIQINKTAAARMPNQPQPYITLAKIYNNINMKDSGRICLQKALEINPGNAEATKILQSMGQ